MELRDNKYYVTPGEAWEDLTVMACKRDNEIPRFVFKDFRVMPDNLVGWLDGIETYIEKND